MKLHTVSQLQTVLDGDFAWRLKEIADLKSAVKGGALSDRTLIRAGVALLYAHWEGFVKLAATSYISFVDLQGKRYDQLQTCFSVFGMRKHVADVVGAKKSSVRIAAIEFILGSRGAATKLKAKAAIDTE